MQGRPPGSECQSRACTWSSALCAPGSSKSGLGPDPHHMHARNKCYVLHPNPQEQAYSRRAWHKQRTWHSQCIDGMWLKHAWWLNCRLARVLEQQSDIFLLVEGKEVLDSLHQQTHRDFGRLHPICGHLPQITLWSKWLQEAAARWFRIWAASRLAAWHLKRIDWKKPINICIYIYIIYFLLGLWRGCGEVIYRGCGEVVLRIVVRLCWGYCGVTWETICN